MIARDAESQSLKFQSPSFDFPTPLFGDELPSVSCNLSDLNISTADFEQLMLQDVPLSLDGSSMDCDDQSQLSVFDFTSVISEASKQARDFDLSFPLEGNMISFLQSLPVPAQVPDGSLAGATPPFSGGSTPQSQSRAASPAWSESSGNLSASSVSGISNTGMSSQTSNPIPRHKRPSHRRAEVKRRDKIKTSLDKIRSYVPSLQDKGKPSESAVLFKAAEYIHQLKDGFSEQGIKATELRQEIQCLSKEIHCFQESLPAGGVKEEAVPKPSLDELYSKWVAENSRISAKHYVFTSLTSSLYASFKRLVADCRTFHSLAQKLKEWQTCYLSLPVLRKQILSAMLRLSKTTTFSEDFVASSDVDSGLPSCTDGNL